jgi:hypothetical protein
MGKPRLHLAPQTDALMYVALSPIAWFVLPDPLSCAFTPGAISSSPRAARYNHTSWLKSYTSRGLAIRPLEIEDGIPPHRLRGRHLLRLWFYGGSRYSIGIYLKIQW